MSRQFIIYKTGAKLPKKKSHDKRVKTPTRQNSLVGKTVMFRLGDDETHQKIAGVVRAQAGAVLEVAYAIPNSDGILIVAKDATTHVLADDVTELNAVVVDGRDVKSWRSREAIKDCKAAKSITDADGRVIDYQGVTFEGYGSTFQGTTAEDRDGDYIVEGAFDKSLRRFKENPVLLTDHTRSVRNLMGHYEKISVNSRGLAMKGVITDSPHPDAQHVRFQIVEGSLKTLSIGGLFFYRDDYKGIEEIELHETSLVVIPANPDATFQVRQIDGDFAEKSFRFHAKRYGGEVRLKNS